MAAVGAHRSRPAARLPDDAAERSTPPGVRSRRFFGGDGLWTLLWAHGLVVVPKEDIRAGGALGMKFPWWRGPGVRGHLRVTGAEVGSRRPVSARTAGYRLTGFNASMIFFPTEGCYGSRAGPGERSSRS